MSYKTTKKNFAEFKKECEYWIEYFGLSDWQIHFDHCEVKDGRASCWADIIGKLCTIELSTEWNASPVKWEIKKVAFHEICELLINQLGVLAKWGHSIDIVNEQLHYVIRRLENTIFKEKRG